MQKIIQLLSMIFGFCMFSAVYAYPQFCCSDSNWQQETLDQFHDPQTQSTNFSFPSGIFRKTCTNCEYDMKTVRCYCQDIAGQVSYFPTYFTVDHCQQIFDNRGGFLKCW